jgi:hypothetical protein
MAEIVAKRLVEHLERSGFVVMKRPAIGAVLRSGEALMADAANAQADTFRPRKKPGRVFGRGRARRLAG